MFEKAISLRTEKESTVFSEGWGECYERMNQLDRAAAAYEKNIAEFPESAAVRWDYVEASGEDRDAGASGESQPDPGGDPEAEGSAQGLLSVQKLAGI